MEANRQAGIPAFLEWLDEDNLLAPFRAYSRGNEAEISTALQVLDNNRMGRNQSGFVHHWRANALGWMEACAFVLQSTDDPTIRELLDTLVRGIVAAHQHQEFLTTYYGDEFEKSYQLGNPAHLIQAAIAHHRATGSTEFLECAQGVADSICEKFQGDKFAEHPNIEMALVELYRSTGNRKYLEGARHFLTPLLTQAPVIGAGYGPYEGYFGKHVVRQPYILCGGADYIAETGNQELLKKLLAIWNDMTRAKIHLTGQLAVEPENPEVITQMPFQFYGAAAAIADKEWEVNANGVKAGFPFEKGLELCEAVGTAYWNWRMLAITGEAKYADLFERTLYNGFLAHVSLDHKTFFYLCPVASDGKCPLRNVHGHPNTACCPPNALRFVASVPGYFFSTSDEGLWVHLYDNCRLDWRLSNGTPLTLVQKTRYPFDGKVTLEVSPQVPTTFDLNLRIPGWCQKATVTVNGENVDSPLKSGSYQRFSRQWKPHDLVTIDLSMPVVAVVADSRALGLRDKVALMRGPLVHCFEGVDHPDLDVQDIRISTGPNSSSGGSQGSSRLYETVAELPPFTPVSTSGLLGGITVLRGPGGSEKVSKAELTAIPYYAWANRGASPMRIWVGRQAVE
jgi:hypothetical protein